MTAAAAPSLGIRHTTVARKFLRPGHAELRADTASVQLSRDPTPAQLAAESFPGTAADAVVAAVNSGSARRTIRNACGYAPGRIRPSCRSG